MWPFRCLDIIYLNVAIEHDNQLPLRLDRCDAMPREKQRDGRESEIESTYKFLLTWYIFRWVEITVCLKKMNRNKIQIVFEKPAESRQPRLLQIDLVNHMPDTNRHPSYK